MKSRGAIILVLMFSLMLRLRADEAVDRFAKTLGEGNEDLWDVSDDGMPRGGYLYRFDLDVDGDGEPEVFLTSSLSVTRNYEQWSVFHKEKDGKYRLLEKCLQISADSLWMKEENGIRKCASQVILRPNDGKSCVSFFYLDKNKGWKESGSIIGDDVDVQNDEEFMVKFHLKSRLTVTIQKILLMRYLQNPSNPWRPVNPSKSLAQQYLDPADAEDIKAAAHWTPPAIKVPVENGKSEK